MSHSSILPPDAACLLPPSGSVDLEKTQPNNKTDRRTAASAPLRSIGDSLLLCRPVAEVYVEGSHPCSCGRQGLHAKVIPPAVLSQGTEVAQSF